MPKVIKQRAKAAAPAHYHTRIVAPPPSDPGEGNEEWRKLTVKPELKTIVVPDPEKGIGKRIAYCRGQLDNLTVEALSQYTKHFDKKGLARTTIVRYESGDNLPGTRELRILCDTLWVPVNWLLFGFVDSASETLAGKQVLEALQTYIQKVSGGLSPEAVRDLITGGEKAEIAQRQRWIYEARKPPSKG